jgi:hypothetical protein
MNVRVENDLLGALAVVHHERELALSILLGACPRIAAHKTNQS